MNEPEPEDAWPADMALVGAYRSVAQANDHALVILAMEGACWLQDGGPNGDYLLFTGGDSLEKVREELALYDAEQQARRDDAVRPEWPTHGSGVWWTFVWVIVLVSVFLWQGENAKVSETGKSSSIGLIDGREYWRPLTAQFLHGDIEHLAGNLIFGVLYSLLAARTLRAIVAWPLILLSGCLANVATSLFYYPEPFTSLGASTAVFGAWGILTGCGVYVAFRSPDHEPWAQVIIPLGGGLALLGWLGFGGGQANVDVLGHVFGFSAGAVLGAGAAAVKLFRLRRLAAT